MSTPESVTPTDVKIETKNRYAALAAAIARSGSGDTAALARLNPDDLAPHQIAAAVRVLLAAGLNPEHWNTGIWSRWALIAHGIALAGHDGSRPFGEQLAIAGVAESRVTKLLTARGDAFTALVPRLLRLLASHGVAPNWNELGRFIHEQAASDPEGQQRAEDIRLKIASRYFSALDRQERQAAT